MNVNAASARRVAFTLREPIGVVVAVSAFNHPLNLIVHQVGPAIAAGCPVIVKPAGDTPLSCLRFVEILHEAGLPADWCQALVIDDTTLATQLVTDRRVGFFSFIGSARVGWMLRSKLAPGTRCALEHGGVAPAIVAAGCRPRRGGAQAGQGRLLSRRPGVRVGAAHLRAPLDRRAARRAHRRAAPARSRSAIRPRPRPRSGR